MGRDYKEEFDKRVYFIRDLLKKSGAEGIVYGNSGGKDSVLVGILCKAACENTVGLIMPCSANRNYGIDTEDGLEVAAKYGIETRVVDLSPVKESVVAQLDGITELNKGALTNIAPRLRMTTLYAVAASENRLVAGTGNRSEYYVGYFTKWGDGGHDFNPIFDLTVREIYEFLRFLEAPEFIINKAPSAGLFDGQTDEGEMGFRYEELDEYLLSGKANEDVLKKIDRLHSISEHKRTGVARYGELK